MQHTAAPAAADCESKAAAPVIDTILAVGFAAATLAAISSDDEAEEGSPTWSVSTLGVGTATTAAFVASAVHGHNSIQTCLAQRQIRSAEDPRKVAAAKKQRAVDHAPLAPPATYVASALAAPR
jgi:hypothetical protein